MKYPEMFDSVGLKDWELDCMHWRGKVLTGLYAHWCRDWDDLPIDESCPEWPCVCEQQLKEYREE